MDAIKFLAHGGSPQHAYSWALSPSSSLPPGTTVDPRTGVMYQTGPLAAGKYTFRLDVSDGLSTVTASFSLELHVYKRGEAFGCGGPGFWQGCPSFWCNLLTDAKAGAGYGASLAVMGGKPPYTWSLATGSLPPD